MPATSSPDAGPPSKPPEQAERPPVEIDEASLQALLRRLSDVEGDLAFFPVRHHSPACAALLRDWIERRRPRVVLIEGPADYNPYLDELLLPHALPIAIYSYSRTKAGIRGMYYPMCEYSPEWVAVRAGRGVGASVAFIDLPGELYPVRERQTHLYADATLRVSQYTQVLCERLQVENFDDLWDKLVESDLDLSLTDYLIRVHHFCLHTRFWEVPIQPEDLRREAYMAEQVRRCMAEGGSGPILVVTGGFHSAAILARVLNDAAFQVCPGIDGEPDAVAPAALSTALGSDAGAPAVGADVTGPDVSVAALSAHRIALTTYSYPRLDNLTGYDAGMPSPGFYEEAFRQRGQGHAFDHRPLLEALVEALRARGQVLSTADLIAVETTAQTLAALRGRRSVWRTDLIDGVTAALLKDELAVGTPSPFLDAVHEVLRGRRHGRLAEGTRRPPLVLEIERALSDADLVPKPQARTVDLDLLREKDRTRSRLLHRLSILDVAGFALVDGTDFVRREDIHRLWEQWRLQWSPGFDATCVEASRYGTVIDDAVGRRLLEEAQGAQAEAAAALLVRAAQADVVQVAAALLRQLGASIQREPAFIGAATALEHLVYLYCHDEALGTTARPEIAVLLNEAFSRSLWLLELAQGAGDTARLVRGMRALLDAQQRAPLDAEAETTAEVFRRVQADPDKPSAVRGAAAGILWTTGDAQEEEILDALLGFAEPSDLGDYLSGLFAAAREVVQRSPGVLRTLDSLFNRLSGDAFVGALPSLRLAFTYFTPREKHHMLGHLFAPDELEAADLQVSPEDAAQALAIEARVFETLAHYNLLEEEPYDPA